VIDVSAILGGRDFFFENSAFFSAFNRAAGMGILSASMYADAKTYLAEDILTKVDRASMAVSLETRVPFLDFRVSNLAMALPNRMKMGYFRNRRKLILQKLLSRYIPSSFFDRPKHGFSLPMAQWLRGDLKWMLDVYLNEERLRSEGLLCPSAVRKIVDEHLQKKRNRDALLWALITWQMWRDQWDI
jgi:asparagine synthase (glutamine-hydrolysing)